MKVRSAKLLREDHLPTWVGAVRSTETAINVWGAGNFEQERPGLCVGLVFAATLVSAVPGDRAAKSTEVFLGDGLVAAYPRSGL